MAIKLSTVSEMQALAEAFGRGEPGKLDELRMAAHRWGSHHEEVGDTVRAAVGIWVGNEASDVVRVLNDIQTTALQVSRRLARIAEAPGKVNTLGELSASSDSQRLDRLCVELGVRKQALGAALSAMRACEVSK